MKRFFHILFLMGVVLGAVSLSSCNEDNEDTIDDAHRYLHN